MYDKCYFCLDQLPKLKKESTASFFVTFWRSRGTKEPAYITVMPEATNKQEWTNSVFQRIATSHKIQSKQVIAKYIPVTPQVSSSLV